MIWEKQVTPHLNLMSYAQARPVIAWLGEVQEYRNEALQNNPLSRQKIDFKGYMKIIQKEDYEKCEELLLED